MRWDLLGFAMEKKESSITDLLLSIQTRCNLCLQYLSETHDFQEALRAYFTGKYPGYLVEEDLIWALQIVQPELHFIYIGQNADGCRYVSHFLAMDSEGRGEKSI